MGVVFKGKPAEIFGLVNLTVQMKTPQHEALRSAFRATVDKVWPEGKIGITQQDPLWNIEREVEIPSDQQSALGLGLWDIFNHNETTDLTRMLIKELCATGKLYLSKWLAKKISSLPTITELLESDDGPVSDEQAEGHA